MRTRNKGLRIIFSVATQHLNHLQVVQEGKSGGHRWNLSTRITQGRTSFRVVETEDRLRDDRAFWKHAAEYYQQVQHEGGGDGGEDEEEVTPSESPTNLGPDGPGGGIGGDPGGSSLHSS